MTNTVKKVAGAVEFLLDFSVINVQFFKLQLPGYLLFHNQFILAVIKH